MRGEDLGPAMLGDQPVLRHRHAVDLWRVVLRAGLPADGFVVLLDTYNPDWHADVDGTAAPLMRANGLFRAVPVRQGTHVVTFTYRPSKLYLGAQVSAVTALGLLIVCLRERRRA